MINDMDWDAWTRQLQQALGALLADTIDRKEPTGELWDLVQCAIELEAEAAALVDQREMASRPTIEGPPPMLWVTERHIDMTTCQTYNVIDWYETRFNVSERRGLYASCAKEYGRAASMYRNNTQVGWVFERRVRYEDSQDAYLREVWIEVSIGDPRRPTPPPRVVSPWAK